MLEDTSYRDRTQVISRWNQKTYNRSKGTRRFAPRVSAHNILMIDQLWLWRIPAGGRSMDSAVITCFPSRKGSTPSYLDNLRDNILADRHRNPLSNIDDFVAQVLSTCIGIFDHNHDVESLQFLKFFESAIGNAVCTFDLLCNNGQAKN
jgi:hypothetical protein